MKLNEYVKEQLEHHPNVYYAYSDQGLIREIDEDPNKKLKKAKKINQKKKGQIKWCPRINYFSINIV